MSRTTLTKPCPLIPGSKVRIMKTRHWPSGIERVHQTTMRTSIRVRRRLASSLAQISAFNSLIYLSITMLIINHLVIDQQMSSPGLLYWPASSVLLVSGHVVFARDDQGQHLVLTGDDGGKGGKDGENDQLVIAGSQMGSGGQDSNMVLEDASNREGDIVMSGKSLIIPGEDGHIVLADSRNHNQHKHLPPTNPLIFWAPYINSKYLYRLMTTPYYG